MSQKGWQSLTYPILEISYVYWGHKIFSHSYRKSHNRVSRHLSVSIVKKRILRHVNFVLSADLSVLIVSSEGHIFEIIWWHDNRFEVNWPPEPTLVLRWISKFFLFGALPSDTFKIKHTKNLKEIPSRHVLENLLEKSKHSCLYTSETHWQFTGILPIYNGRHAKFHNSKL